MNVEALESPRGRKMPTEIVTAEIDMGETGTESVTETRIATVKETGSGIETGIVVTETETVIGIVETKRTVTERIVNPALEGRLLQFLLPFLMTAGYLVGLTLQDIADNTARIPWAREEGPPIMT